LPVSFQVLFVFIFLLFFALLKSPVLYYII